MKNFFTEMRQMLGLRRNYLRKVFGINDTCIYKHMGQEKDMQELELMRCIIALLKQKKPGMPRVCALLDIMGVYLYKNATELPELNSVDGKPLFEEHPRKILEDHNQQLLDILNSKNEK